jgi:ribose 5-phosphate isomerase B
MNIYIGADHNGFEDKNRTADLLKSLGHQVIDEGDRQLDREDDFPVYAADVAKHVLNDKGSRGILICGSGQGMVMAANRFKGIRASICWDIDEAFLSRNDDDSNVLCLSAKKTNWREMEKIIQLWLSTPFEHADRFIRRIEELDRIG